MPGGHWGPWEPYTQTVEGLGVNEVISGISRQTIGVGASLISSSPYQLPAIYEDLLARQCCMRHVQAGSYMDALWNQFSSCPPMSPALGGDGTVPGDCGIAVGYGGGPGLYSTISVAAKMTAFGVIANKQLTAHGIPSWSDPAGAYSAPPTYDYAGGKLYKWDYDVFTDLHVTASLDTPIAFDTPLTWTARGVEILAPVSGVPSETWTWHPITEWNPTADGALKWTIIVEPSGLTVSGGTIECPNILGDGHIWQFVPDLVSPGFFFNDDPYSAGFGYAAWHATVDPSVGYVVQRIGRRRRWLTTSPPLQQRQRSDGLGGGPPHAGRGLATRQHGLHQAGIY